MAQIFHSFVSGVDAGTQQREQRDRRTALDEAGRLYAANDAQGAENALMGAGLVNEAGAYSALNEARRGRRTREAVSGAMTNLDPGASPTDRLNAGATAALGEGDTDQWFAFQQAASQMSAQQREEAGQRAQWIGSAAASLLDVPVEQRVGRAQALLASSPYANDQHVAQMIDEAGELSDEALNAAAHNSMGAADILAGRERRERYAVQDRQFNQQLAQSHENAAYARNPDAAPISDSQRRGLTNDYNRAVSGAMDDLGILRPSLPYARLAVTNNGETSGIEGVNVRSSDVALLRAAARAQTGPGVLTESEVFSTLSPSLQQDLIRNRAYLDISSEGLSAADRLALSQFVMQSARNVQRDTWDLYDQASTDWGSRGNAPTFQAPRIPHPDDEGRLQAAERGGAQVGRSYVANNGRTYRFLGPGSWEFERMGGQRDPNQPLLVDPRAQPGGQTESQPQRSSNSPQYSAAVAAFDAGADTPQRRAEFQRDMGVSIEEARRRSAPQQSQQPTGYHRTGRMY